MERLGDITILRCRPHTGRQHQIRVHLWHAGHPICGDKLYGTDTDFFLRSMSENIEMPVGRGLTLKRHALHAHSLSFSHPVTGQKMQFNSPLPADLVRIVRGMREGESRVQESSIGRSSDL